MEHKSRVIHNGPPEWVLAERLDMPLLQDLADEIREINKANGWEQPGLAMWATNPNGILAKHALVTTEVAEATEAVRFNDLDNHNEELADIVIRVLELAGGLCDDFDKVVRDKLEKNKGRGFKHGGKRV